MCEGPGVWLGCIAGRVVTGSPHLLNFVCLAGVGRNPQLFPDSRRCGWEGLRYLGIRVPSEAGPWEDSDRKARAAGQV